MFFGKFLKVSILSTLMLFAAGGISHASVWKQDDNGAWRYVRNNGAYATDSWVQSNDDWYYMDSDGYIAKDVFIESGNHHSYYIKDTGVMARNEWISFFDEENPGLPIWYYFGDDGKAFKGRENKLNPRSIDGKSYAFDADGHMVRGFVTENGEQVEDTGSNLEFTQAMYFFGEDGAMYRNQWLKYEDVGRNGIYSELAQRHYNEFDELWLYFGEKGRKMTATNTSRAKQSEIDGITYSFDENGVMIPRLFVADFAPTASASDAMQRSATASNATIRYGNTDESGANTGDYWTFMVPNEEMSEEDYHMQEYSWFRTRSNGTVIKNRIAKVLERKYAFDEIGRMQTGFVVMYEDGTFGKQYDIDNWSREDFLINEEDSMLLPLWRGNLYLFGTDELNDGSMKTGAEIPVILQDGPATFGFRQNGIAYGNRFTLERVDGKYYFNGLRLDADEDIGYGVVKDTRYGEDAYIVVDTQGRRIKGRKRVIADNEGNWILIKNDLFYARVDSGEKPRWKNNDFYFYDSSMQKTERYSTDPVQKHIGIDSAGFEIVYNATY